MADFDRQYQAQVQAGARADVRVIDEGLRAFMIRVYNYMAAGVGLTGLIAYFAVATGIYQQIAATPFIWVVVFAPLAMVFLISARISRMSMGGAQLAFWAFAALMGLSLGWVFLAYTQTSIARVFFITAASFGALSLWGYTTKKDISGWGSFLFMGLIGIIIAMLVNIFLASGALQFAISVIGVLVFAGLTAYDTQRIKEMYYVGDDGTVAGRKAIMGALSLYLDFINLLLFLLQLFGDRR